MTPLFIRCVVAFTVLVLHAGSSGAVISIPADTNPPLRLARGTLRPVLLDRQDPSALAFLPSSPSVALLQFAGPIRVEWKKAVTDAGVHLVRYIPDYGFVARGTREAFERALRQSCVRWIGPYPPENRISPVLPDRGRTTALIACESWAVIGEIMGAVANAGLEATPARSLLPSPLLKRAFLLRVTGDTAALHSLARRDDIAWIGPVPAMRLLNDRSRAIAGVDSVWSDIGLHGEGQVVAISDTGLDTGQLDTLQPAFQGRVQKGIPLVPGGNWTDEHGHGTHLAGAIAGQGDGPDLPGANSFAGMAPRARLVIQAVELDSLGYEEGLPDDLNDLFDQAYQEGARIHNDSWGDFFSPYGSYSLHAGQVDDFIHRHPDMTIVFAAGNHGTDSPVKGKTPDETSRMTLPKGNGIVQPGSLLAPGTAKNAIAVGASEGYRPASENWGGFTAHTWRLYGFQTPPLSIDPMSDNPDGMTAFSSRGPTSDGRIKPDLVTPGSNIISVLSQRGLGSRMWGSYGKGYAFNGGSSISAAFASAGAALIRQFLQERRGIDPSAALVKAVLLNGARDLHPGQYGTEGEVEIPRRPNHAEGWGRIDIAGAVSPPAPLAARMGDVSAGLITGERREWRFRVREAGHGLRIMLVWSDAPGSPEAGIALVNDLDLRVTGPDGVRFGNDGPDRRNNVEGVEIDQAPTGVYRLAVEAPNVPEGPQPFALALRGAVGRLTRPGDVDGDDRITVLDALMTLRAALGLEMLDDDAVVAADMIDEGSSANRIDIRDTVAILRTAVGLSLD